MREEKYGPSSATITLSSVELVSISNALNEVCNGVRDLDDDNEFATRLGTSRADARRLLSEFSVLVDRVSGSQT